MSGPRPRGGACGPGQGWVKTCPAATRCRAAALSDSSSLLVVHRAEMLNAREPAARPTQPGPPSPPTRSSRCEPALVGDVCGPAVEIGAGEGVQQGGGQVGAGDAARFG